MDAYRDTVGKISSDLLKNSGDDTHSAHEQMQESLTDFDKNMHECIGRLKKDWPFDDFYIVVITKRERKLANVIRNYFMGRLSCPTPQYDESVYFYHNKDDHLEFLWVLPSKQTYYEMLADPLSVPTEERSLLNFVLDDASGDLLKKVKIRNRELIVYGE
jgi:hypothetical protein